MVVCILIVRGGGGSSSSRSLPAVRIAGVAVGMNVLNLLQDVVHTPKKVDLRAGDSAIRCLLIGARHQN